MLSRTLCLGVLFSVCMVFNAITLGQSTLVAEDSNWSAGAEVSIVKPFFDGNLAFTTIESDAAASFERVTETEFDYDAEATPRVWLMYDTGKGVGLQARFWLYDQRADQVSASPPANGFGEITHPPFGSVDISSVVPTDVFTADSDLDAYTIDLEITKYTFFCEGWYVAAAAGVRYGSISQTYNAELRDGGGTLVGAIDFSHSQRGVGPILSLETRRDTRFGLTPFALARGSLLFGDGDARLTAGEDLDLANPLITTQVTSRDEIVPIGELQLGVEWNAPEVFCCLPFIRLAFEAQIWGGVGNAASEDGDVGFAGFVIGAGVVR